MAGYHGYSMSNNAVDAYNDGEMPKSKWTKASILDEVQRIIEEDEGTNLDLAIVSKLTKVELADLFLTCSSWHHTSLHFNKTDFYRVDVDGIDTDKALSIIADRQPKAPKPAPVAEPITYADIEYGSWEGSRKHPKLVMHTAQAVIKGNWAYTLDGDKKKMDGKYLTVIKSYSRKPQGFDTILVTRIKNKIK